MRVLTFDEFTALPDGVIFSYFQPQVCEGLFRRGSVLKDERGARDYFQASLVPDCVNGGPPEVGPTESRWGIFDFGQLYAVFEEADLAVLRTMIG